MEDTMADMGEISDVGDEAFTDPYEMDWDDDEVSTTHSEFQRLLDDTEIYDTTPDNKEQEA